MESQRINLKQISMRARTKKEIFRILHLEGDIYLPPIAQSNRKYIAGVLSGKIKVSRLLTTFYIAFEKLSIQEYPSSTFGRAKNEWNIGFCLG